ncbi:MAG: amidohydrolase family protein, partial [Acidobacteria bacterium]|nr:amidohydrolase family protein [Acidobacteriota bacterium]
MRSVTLGVSVAIVVLGYSAPPGASAPPQAAVTVFEGARLIRGDGSAPLEDAAFVVEAGILKAVGPRGQVSAPARATRVSLSGKTVIPVLVDLHAHVGFSRDGVFAPEHYTHDNIVDQLKRLEYYGVGAILSLGTDVGVDTFRIRDEQRAGQAGGATLYLAGRGFVAPGGGPPVAPLEHVPYEVERPGLGRIFVRELAAQKVDMVKIWVDDRNGTKPKLAPEVYRAIIDEAHKQGLRVMAHVYYLEDAKALVRAGVDGFAHLVRDRDVDDEFVQLMKEHKVFTCAALGVQATA